MVAHPDISPIHGGHIVPAGGGKGLKGDSYQAVLLALCECWRCVNNPESVTGGSISTIIAVTELKLEKAAVVDVGVTPGATESGSDISTNKADPLYHWEGETVLAIIATKE